MDTYFQFPHIILTPKKKPHKSKLKKHEKHCSTIIYITHQEKEIKKSLQPINIIFVEKQEEPNIYYIYLC